MSGILGSLPNSNRKIEPELMRRLIFDSQVESIISSSGVEMKGLELLGRRPHIGSLSVTDEFSSDEMHRFRMNLYNIPVSQVSGSEIFLGEFLKPSFNNTLLSSEMLDLMKMNQFGRCQIGSEVFSSSISIRHAKSSYILAKFITKDGTVDCYPGQVQYYFTHTVDLPNGPAEHFLVYVHWYEP